MAGNKEKTIKKPSGIKIDGTPNVPWRKFQERLSSYDITPVKEWKAENVLGHILKRYKDYNGMSFTLSYSGPPTKCTEIYCVKRAMSLLDGDNPDMEMVKNYIDWCFDHLLAPKKMQLESLAFFFTAKIVKEFKAKYKKHTEITRSTQLPKNIEEILSKRNIDDVFTYGELSFVKKAIESNPDNEGYANYKLMFIDLENIGFNTGLLDLLD